MSRYPAETLVRWHAWVEALRDRPRLYVLDDRYLTVCAALVGFEEGIGGRLLDDFTASIAIRHPAIRNHYFPLLVVAEALPDRAARGLGALTEDEEAIAKRRLFELLTEFLESPRVGMIDPDDR